MTLLGLLTVAVLTARRYRIVSFSILWCFLHLAIESTFIPLELVYEHRMYLPMVGISLLAAWCLFTLLSGGRRPLIAISLLILLLTMATYQRNNIWRDSQVLWEDIVAKYPGDARAHYNLGVSLASKSHDQEAIHQYLRAIEIRPDYAQAHNNLGNALARQRKPDGAIRHLRRAVSLNPALLQTRTDLASLLAMRGEVAEAVKLYRQTLQVEPDFLDAHFNLAICLASQGDREEAHRHFQTALDLATTQGDESMADAIRKRLESF